MKFFSFKLTVFSCCLLIATGAVSCKKFLAAYSQNNSFLESANDLDELLVGDTYNTTYDMSPWYLHLMDDDVEMNRPEGALNPFENYGFYTWQANPRINNMGKVNQEDSYFKFSYQYISRCNAILYNVPLLAEKNEPADQLRRIRGEAHFLRGFYYFVLNNTFGKPWQTSTAATDAGIPLKTDPQVEDHFFVRSTVKEVYEQVLEDLKAAEQELDGFNTANPIRANQAAAQALLSRVYLYMEDYEQALAWAEKALMHSGYKVKDLNDYTEGSDFFGRSSPEILFSMGIPVMGQLMNVGSETYYPESFHISAELTEMYSREDLRLKAYYEQSSKGFLKAAKMRRQNPNDQDVSENWLLRYPELLLNKAEALAMLGRDQQAIDALQQLRKFRFKPSELTPVTVSGEALVNFIRDERRRELSFETHRWFDLRRYAVNAKYPFVKKIRHIAYTNGANGYFEDGYYELNTYPEDKATYMVPIPRNEIEFNSGVLKNEDRPQRPLKH